MLKDEPRLDAGHFRTLREGFQGKGAQMFGVADRDMNEEIIRSSHVEESDHFAQSQGMGAEGFDFVARMPRQTDGDDRLQADAESFWVDLGMGTS